MSPPAEAKTPAQNYVVWALSGVVLFLFAFVWVWVGIKVLGFDASADAPKVTFSEAQITIAGFLAATVAAGTASVLGIEVQQVKVAALKAAELRAAEMQAAVARAPESQLTEAQLVESRRIAPQSLAFHVSKAVAQSWFLKLGIGVYAAVGLFVLAIYFFRSGVAPDMVGAFSLGVLGWFAGAFSAVYQAT
jgi:hypothetical protein